ncbi:hypothetical protein ABT272_30885 [Streptomyces sp900105245]|uniref:HNH endonuclease n=1 Tax=Streptomyces sp. 900105245 TaxID=3154379 RepID=A0ABV1UFT4_9ACTN
MSAQRKPLPQRRREAEASASRAAGYCGLVPAEGGASCTRWPHDDRRHVDHYNGRKQLGDASGTEWFE